GVAVAGLVLVEDAPPGEGGVGPDGEIQIAYPVTVCQDALEAARRLALQILLGEGIADLAGQENVIAILRQPRELPLEDVELAGQPLAEGLEIDTQIA